MFVFSNDDDNFWVASTCTKIQDGDKYVLFPQFYGRITSEGTYLFVSALIEVTNETDFFLVTLSRPFVGTNVNSLSGSGFARIVKIYGVR